MIKKRIFRVFLYIIFIFLLVFIIFFNKDYHFDKVIKDYNSYKKYKIFNYVTIDLRNTKMHRLTDKELKSNKYDGYILDYDGADILVILKKNTQIDKEIQVTKKNYNKIANNVIKDLEKIDSNIKLEEKYYTNENFNINGDIYHIKLLVLYSIIGLLIFLLLKEIILILIKK